MASLATVATVATIAGTAISAGAAVYSAYSQYQQGEAIQEEANRQALMDELHGKNEFAAAQREARLREIEGQLIMSRQQALAAASGGGAGPEAPTILKIMADTEASANYGAASVLYGGASRQDDYLASATSRRVSGRNNFFGSIASAVGTLAGGIGRLGETSNQWAPALRRLTERPSPAAWAAGSGVY